MRIKGEKLMGYIIIDLEFNNLNNIEKYDNKFYEKNGDFSNLDLENEIIEIGAVKVDKYMKVVGKMREYIKPTVFPVINPIVTDITKIDMETLKSRGKTFEEAMNNLKEMFEEGDVLCSWAKDDVAELIINSKHHNYTEINWLNKYLDIQEYACKVLGHKKALGLKNALDELRIKVDDTKLHDALNDAEYTTQVLRRIYNGRVISRYIVDDIYDMPALHVKNLESIEISEDELKLCCPKCKSKIRLEVPIKLLNWRFATVGKCTKCNNNVLCEILVKKTLSGKCVYKEVNSIINEEVYLNYLYKFENMNK